jgi:hypothetical protein
MKVHKYLCIHLDQHSAVRRVIKKCHSPQTYTLQIGAPRCA